MKRFVCILLLMIFATPFFAVAQEKEIYQLPSWLILEYGRKAYEEREYGVALRYAREALEKQNGYYPEAEILIGDVFDAEGNKDLAIRQYEKALDMSKQLYVLNEKYEIFYKLGNIYFDRDSTAYEKTLQTILEDDEMYKRAVRTDLGMKMISMLMEEGLNKLLVLYRLQSYHSLEAHSALGRLYYEQDQYQKAALHFIFSVVTVFSRCIEEYKLYDPEYIYEDAVLLFELTKRYEAVQEYLRDTHLFLNLYLLGKTMEALNGKTELIKEIWDIVRIFSKDSRFKKNVEEEMNSLS